MTTHPGASLPAGASAQDRVREGAYRKVTLHLIPFIFICYLFNYLDRVNVGFAKLQMLDALQWSESVYGLGAGIFFIGYVASGVPSNLLLHRLGARKVIGTLMIAWGIASACLMFVTTPAAFYSLRFITGVFEAGFFPGIVLYFTNWYPASRRGRIMGLFMSAIPISGLLGSPLSGWMMQSFAGHGGLAGWQWMFLLQGIPTILLGFLVYVLLNDGIAQAKWLNTEEKQLLRADLDEDERQRRNSANTADTFASVLRNKHVWMLGLVYFCIQMGVYAINFWLPTIVKSLGFASPVDQRHSLLVRQHLHDLGGPFGRQAQGTPLAFERPPADGAVRPAAGHPGARQRGRRPHRPVAGNHGRAVRPAHVLALADGVSRQRGGGRRPGADQFAGPGGRFRQPLPRRLDQGCDGRHRRGPVYSFRSDAAGRHTGAARSRAHR